MNKVDINTSNDFEALKASRQAALRASENTKAEGALGKPELAVAKDKIEVSGEAAALKDFVDRIKGLSGIREAKVEDIKSQIDTGKYNPPGEDIAEAILRDVQG